jgi:hypothetical protein
MRSSQSHDAYFNVCNVQLDCCSIARTRCEPRSRYFPGSRPLGSQHDMAPWPVFAEEVKVWISVKICIYDIFLFCSAVSILRMTGITTNKRPLGVSQNVTAEWWVVSTPSFSGGHGFKSRSGVRLFCVTFSAVFLSFSRQIPRSYLKRPMPCPYKSFPIRYSQAILSFNAINNLLLINRK